MNWLDSTVGLRLILLAAGLLLIVALIWLDRRRRQAGGSAQPAERLEGGSADDGVTDRPTVREEPAFAAARTGTRNASAHRPLPVIDWSALERDSGAATDDEPRLAVHTMSPGPAAAEADPTPLADAAADTAPDAAPADAGALPGAPTIAHWPPENVRRICSLRIAPPTGERFSGRVLRQGLQGAGFVHGELGVFHLADEQGRALISAANLARPGQLDPSIMDFQRFGGLHLFTVLPGPMPDAQLLGRLFTVVGELAERVAGVPQDERGAPLTSARRHELLHQYAGVPLSAEPPTA